MDRISAPEQNRILGGIANLLRKIEQDSGPEFLPRSLDVMGLVRQLALPSAETVEKLSYGDPLFRMPTQSNIPITTDRGYLAEVLGMAPVVPAASRATTRISNEMADQLVKAITRNPEATAPGALQAAGEMAPLARITGYHGSPHGPISQFDFEKVGSGAGTTNFGYGTYIAEHPAIAGMFRKGRTPSSDNPDGFLYQVDIPDEIIPKMLNWYEEVPEGVRKNLSEKAAQKFGTGLTGTTGERLYKDLAFSFKMDGSKNPEKDASKWLAEQGVPGIQYENLQMVRGMGRDTNNYVLFEPEKIKIEKINEENAQDFLSARGLLEPQAVQNPLYQLTKEEFLGNPQIISPKSSQDLKPRTLTTNVDVPPEPFMGGKYDVKMSEDGAAVLDGDKVIASYNFGKTLVVDPKYRKQGIAEELVYQWRSRYPGAAQADTRTKASQRVQEKVWDRIQNEKFVAESNM